LTIKRINKAYHTHTISAAGRLALQQNSARACLPSGAGGVEELGWIGTGTQTGACILHCDNR
jgi:hypothetical protein